MGGFEEVFSCLFVHHVGVAAAIVPVAQGGAVNGETNRLAVDIEFADSPAGGRGDAGEIFVKIDPLQTELLVLGDQAAGISGWPAVLIVDPGGKAEFFAFLNAGSDHIEPAFGKVSGRQSGAGVHKDSAESHLFEKAHLPFQFDGIQFSVP